jgi:replicative DNA helicase
VKTISEYFKETQEFLKNKQNSKMGEFPTGVKSLDEFTGGLDRGQIMVIGGSSGSGKSSLAMQMAFNLSHTKEVLVFSLEMTGRELAGRLFCMDMAVNNVLLRTGYSYDQDYESKLRAFKSKISINSLQIMEDKGYRFKEIVEVMENGYKNKKPDIIFLDHLHLIEWAGNQNEAIIVYLRQLTELVKTNKIALVILSQLRRPPAGTNYERIPTRFDLLGSGSIDQIAHQVAILYKQLPDKYFINLDKNRMGETKEDIEIDFQGQFYAFRDIKYNLN